MSNRIPKLSIVSIMLVALAPYSIAESKPKNMQDTLCITENASNDALLAHSQSTSPLSEKGKQILEEMMNHLSSGNFAKHLALNEQMSVDQAVKLETLSQQFQMNQLATLIESKRERDIIAINNMASIARELSDDRFSIEDASGVEQQYVGILVAMREFIDADAISQPDASDELPCNLETALVTDFYRAMQRVNDIYGISEAMADVQSLISEYGSPIDKSKLTPSQLSRLENDIFPVIEEANHRLVYANDLLMLANLERISKVMLEASRQDQYLAPGDLDFSGSTWKQMVDKSEVSELDISFAKVWSVLNDAVPARAVQDWDALIDMTENTAE